MNITNKYIEGLNPCKARQDNYLANYKDTEFTIVEFLKLDKISYEDKLWVWQRSTSKEVAVEFALKCAESILHIFEGKYPNDNRPRKAVEALRNYIKDPSIDNEKRCMKAAAAAADAAADAAAYAAAYAAADAAAAAVDAAAYAAADAAAAAYAADAAAYAAAAADASDACAAASSAETRQLEKNLQFLIETYIEKEV